MSWPRRALRYASRLKAQGALGATILTVFLVYPLQAFPREILTTIDLSYGYTQTRLGDNITGDTSVQQKYEVEYVSALTALFDWRLDASLEIEDKVADGKADTSKVAPSIELEIVGPRARLRAAYDGTRDKTEETREDGGSEIFASSYLLEMEITPDYFPEMKLKVDRKRDYQLSRKEEVQKNVEFSMRKEISELRLEFDVDYTDVESILPEESTQKRASWTGKASYQKTVWRDLDIDLTYEIAEEYSEDFDKGVFVSDDKKYEHELQFKLSKSLDFTPRIKGEFQYEYEFAQDLLTIDYDYEVNQDLRFSLDWMLLHWLDVGGEIRRETEFSQGVPPEDPEEKLKDYVDVDFKADPTRWLSFTGRAKWEFERQVGEGTGGTLDKSNKAAYELGFRHRWGDWWRLTTTTSTEYEYENGWLAGKKSQLKATVDMLFFDSIGVKPEYQIDRTTDYEFNEPLALEQGRQEEFHLLVDYEKDFGELISFGFSNDFGIKRSETVDEVLSTEELVELNEDTKIRLTLAEFIRDMTLDGEITRKATDTQDDEEPMLVDITYTLKWAWVISDFDLEATYEYDDNGDTFDESSFNTKVGWGRDNVNLTGEYQFDKTHSDEIDEGRRVNLSMNMQF